ncbi:MAG: methyltransferase [Synechococcaceae cyanobacterium]|nr:methyltransferase [Synechococcaceae cyanobacterium]
MPTPPPSGPVTPPASAWAPLGPRLAHWGFSRAGWGDNRRGEWWLLAQLLLISALLLPPLPAVSRLGLPWPWPLRLPGAALLALALVAAVRALLQLGPSLTPLPEPLPGAPLVTSGPYARCRHPLYQAVLLAGLALALLLGSPLHLLITLALAGVLGGKARREERSLLQQHPDYAAYRRDTAAIVPRLPWLDWRG